jgi:hypothetical protein
MEIFVVGEDLADQRRAHHRAVALDQTAVGLPREHHLGDAGHGQRISEPGEDRECDSSDDPDRRDQHVDRLDAMNGTMTPPSSSSKRSRFGRALSKISGK